MSGVSYPCPHCKQSMKVDPRQLPEGPATFACPKCKEAIVIDKRELLDKAAAREVARVPADWTAPSGFVVGDNEATLQQISKRIASLATFSPTPAISNIILPALTTATQ